MSLSALILNLIDWSQQQFAHLEWRRERTPYRTWVSEVMLSQTTVSAVQGRLAAFVAQFPDVRTLAQASDEAIVRAWRGLGYYQRAYNLVKAARVLCQQYDGMIPADLEQLRAIPGIGPYTAHAILAIGYDRPYLAVDANIERVWARVQGWVLPKAQIARRLTTEFPATLWTHCSPRALNEALMDLGRTICRNQDAQCSRCPLHSICKAHALNLTLAIPVAPTPLVRHQLELVRFVTSPLLLAYPKRPDQWLSGQWELPTFVIRHAPELEHFAQYPIWPQLPDLILAHTGRALASFPMMKHTITQYQMKNWIVPLATEQLQAWTTQFLPVPDPLAVPLAHLAHKILKKISLP